MRAQFEIYIRAFTHRSWVREHGTGQDNEILEFIGDSVIQLCVSEILIEKFPTKSEGQLSQLRHRLVNNNFFSEIATRLNLGSLLLLGKGEERTGGRTRTRMLANTFEAVLGAIYLDKGINAAKAVILHHMSPYLETFEKQKSPKRLVHEWTQKKYHSTPVYQEIARTGPAHNQRFVIQVLIDGVVIDQGEGTSKRAASHEAAKHAAKKLGLL